MGDCRQLMNSIFEDPDPGHPDDSRFGIAVILIVLDMSEIYVLQSILLLYCCY
jgi:hypothetical protein